MAEPKSVLLMTLNPALRDSRRMLLENCGYAVTTSERPAEVFDMMRFERFNVLLVDDSIAWQSRATLFNEAVRRGMVAVSVQPSISTIGANENARAVLVDSFNPSQLLTAVRFAMGEQCLKMNAPAVANAGATGRKETVNGDSGA